jgi:hypothetical protein
MLFSDTAPHSGVTPAFYEAVKIGVATYRENITCI